MFARVLAAKPHFSGCPRAAYYATAVESQQQSQQSVPDLPLPSLSRPRTQQQPRASAQQTQALVRIKPWRRPSSMAELFSILRAVERKYGRIKEYKVARDLDHPDLYVPTIYASFHDSQAYLRVPTNGETLKASAPAVDPKTPGGIGLADLENLLEPQDRVQEEEPLPEAFRNSNKDSEATEMLDVRVERHIADKPFSPGRRPRSNISDGKQRVAGHMFRAWAGFYAGEQKLPQMERVLQKWNQTLGHETAKEPAATEKREAQAAAEPAAEETVEASQAPPETWEPLPDPAENETEPEPADEVQAQASSKPEQVQNKSKEQQKNKEVARRQRLQMAAAQISRTSLPTQEELEEKRANEIASVEEEKQQEEVRNRFMGKTLRNLFGL